MKDNRTEKIKQHYDIYINGIKYKVLDCKINEQDGVLSVKTKIRGQAFPSNGQLLVSIPSKEYYVTLQVAFRSMFSNTKTECWEYTVLQNA